VPYYSYNFEHWGKLIHDFGGRSSLRITFFIQWFQLLVVPSSSGEASPRGQSENTILEG
jgi:hypothetical protein